MERVLRVFALFIVVAAIIDPAITTNRTSKPEIAVVPSDSVANGALAADIARQLSSSFTVMAGPFTAAAGTVIVGSALPESAAELARPIFAVIPDRSYAPVLLERMVAPTVAPLATRIPVELMVRVRAAGTHSMEATLVLGDLVVDRVVRRVTAGDTLLRVPLSFVPTAPGVASLHASVRVDNETVQRTADIAIDVRDTRWPVLFYDARPSYMSTFVRRGLERDARFVVTSRVTASKGVSRDAGAPPSTLDDPAVRALYRVIVVGAPEMLGVRDNSALEQFMRRRGGSVVLLYDQHVTGGNANLAAVERWESATRSTPVRVPAVGTDSAMLDVTDWMWPARMPENAEVLARAESSGKDSVTTHPVVWQTAMGAGRLIVSGALDAWKFRDPTQSTFENFWQRVLAAAADQSPPPIVVTLSHTVAKPGQQLSLSAQLRDVAFASTSASTLASATSSSAPANMSTASSSASLSADIVPTDSLHATSRPLRMWPSGAAGQFVATFRAPAKAGRYHVHLNADGEIVDVSFIVRTDATQATPADSDLLGAWARASGGELVAASPGRKLGQRIAALLVPISRRVSWHPMRSLWWLPCLTFLLCGEWWLRRRRGLP